MAPSQYNDSTNFGLDGLVYLYGAFAFHIIECDYKNAIVVCDEIQK
jgi:hypothetical protein